jgi:hypothetical protein
VISQTHRAETYVYRQSFDPLTTSAHPKPPPMVPVEDRVVPVRPVEPPVVVPVLLVGVLVGRGATEGAVPLTPVVLVVVVAPLL